MALQRNEKYVGRFSNPSTEHPQGAFKNRSSPTSQDGSYLESDWANDWSGFFERLLTVASVTPNKIADTATNSQYYDALIASVKTALGNAAQRTVGTNATNLPDMSSFGSLKGVNGWFNLPSGVIYQWGEVTLNTQGMLVNLPIPFPTRFSQIVISDSSSATYLWSASATSLSQFRAYSSVTGGLGRWMAIGY